MKENITGFNSKEAAAYFGISPDTLRFYERKGVIPPIRRDKNGYRIFTDVEMNWLYIALSLKQAGLSLEKITEFVHLTLHQSQNNNVAQKEILREQLEELEAKVTDLRETKKILQWQLNNFDKYLSWINNLEAKENQNKWKKFKKDSNS
ncbi:MerR family transcriptional regulator [Limosilactobacillus reuteri]|uniref:MerR family transcriptional regulator n=1 Tax=Limosilactobacillus reuteri TaxID=1598 RepID=UPI001E5CCF24|nr:MerR family transcriptional regulator [Limosilactobacillus reuteri]MCC4382798.1 MerR family transcriptional regulator [Limosilactobacillus reuteri]MCC4400183.1 MerR family transcriptional regulator [Limosilactobacillus reuteri]MCC4403599.1 MerR family transcriptional regulator [Limosilactobacillus reuteri]MCC4411938.1 MerR family transcriptional regulator [Limosilactobacillus reuteri]MCC4414734.1 MerR family transcriptional regulator [Limosilactobacillus reuteri]